MVFQSDLLSIGLDESVDPCKELQPTAPHWAEWAKSLRKNPPISATRLDPEYYGNSCFEDDEPLIGFSMWGLSTLPTDAAVRVLEHAYERNIRMWSGGLHYGTKERSSLHILKAYFDRHPEHCKDTFIHLKGCLDIATRRPRCNPEHIIECLSEIESILGGFNKVNLAFSIARLDPDDCFPEVMKTLQRYSKRSKMDIGLCEVEEKTLLKALKYCDIVVVEVELSPLTQYYVEDALVETCRERGIRVLGSAPLARGLLTQEYHETYEERPPQDHRADMPRFQHGENFHLRSLRVTKSIMDQATQKLSYNGLAFALKWAQALSIIPIPSARTTEHVRQIAACRGRDPRCAIIATPSLINSLQPRCQSSALQVMNVEWREIQRTTMRWEPAAPQPLSRGEAFLDFHAMVTERLRKQDEQNTGESAKKRVKGKGKKRVKKKAKEETNDYKDEKRSTEKKAQETARNKTTSKTQTPKVDSPVHSRSPERTIASPD